MVFFFTKTINFIPFFFSRFSLKIVIERENNLIKMLKKHENSIS